MGVNQTTIKKEPPNPHDFDQYVRFSFLAEMFVVSQFNLLQLDT